MTIVMMVLGLLAVAVAALAFAIVGSIENARLLAAQTRAEGAGRGLIALVEAALADAVASGARVLAPLSANDDPTTAWDIVRAEGGRTCRREPATPTSVLATSPELVGVREKSCFRDWLPAGMSVEELHIGPLGLLTTPAIRGAGFFPANPVVTSAGVLSVTVRDERKQARAMTRAVVQVLSASPFSFQALALGPARLPSIELEGIVHANGDLCLREAELERVTSSGRIGCGGDDAEVDGDDVDITAAAAWPVKHERRILDARHGVGPVRVAFADAHELVRPLKSTDAGATLRGRIASAAATVLVDGTWYRRAPASARWPGTAVWSDHPGRARTVRDESDLLQAAPAIDVGIDTIGNPPARLYSRYDRAGAGGFDPGSEGVVSYGAITRSGGVHVPAAPSASGLVPATTDEGLFAGARMLIVDGTTGRRELPINIDVAALGRASVSLANRELGTTGWNGVLWISSSWPDRATGAPIPEAGGVDDPAQPVADPGGQRALPGPLCSDDAAGSALAGDFKVPACDDDAPRPTIVRLMNGADLRAFGRRGLVIVSDLPVVIVGDWNQQRDTADIPSVVVADRVVGVSPDWTDDAALAVAGEDGVIDRDARLKWRVHLLTGVFPVGGSFDFLDRVGVVESRTRLDHEGSVVLAFSSRTRTTALPASRRLDHDEDDRWDPWATAPPSALSIGVVLDIVSARLP